jgi:hypothetical protein
VAHPSPSADQVWHHQSTEQSRFCFSALGLAAHESCQQPTCPSVSALVQRVLVNYAFDARVGVYQAVCVDIAGLVVFYTHGINT